MIIPPKVVTDHAGFTGEMFEIHTPEEIAAEIEAIRPLADQFIANNEIRPWPNCLENDLRVAAYNRLTDRKLGSQA